MNCKEAIVLIAKFLEQTLTAETLAKFERHLVDCALCRDYLATYRKTVALTGRGEGLEVPERTRTRLRSLLVTELRRGGELT